MKFGKAEDLTGIQFQLPITDERSLAVLIQTLHTASFSLRVGSTAWSCKEWIGKIYPKGIKATNFLSEYQNNFDTIELNTTHYRIPTSEMVQKWKEQVIDNQNFKFCPKWPQTISHYSGLNPHDPRIGEFLAVLSHFGPSLGWSWIQLPEHFGPDKIRQIEAFCSVLPRGLRLAWEFRHPDWFADGQLIAPVRDLLEALGMATIITDVAGRRDVCHGSLTAPVAIIRWVGNALHPTDNQRLAAWAQQLEEWKKQGLQEVWFWVHQPDEILVPEAAEIFEKELSKVNLKIKNIKFIKNIQQFSLF